jgi:hypothetical protein
LIVKRSSRCRRSLRNVLLSVSVSMRQIVHRLPVQDGYTKRAFSRGLRISTMLHPVDSRCVIQRLGRRAENKSFTAMKNPNSPFPLSRSNRWRRKSGKRVRNHVGSGDDRRPRFRKPGLRKMKSGKSGAKL